MNTSKTLLTLLFLIYFYSLAQSQEPTNENATLEQIIPHLSDEDKGKLLHLSIQLGEKNIDDVLLNLYKQASPANQKQIDKAAFDLYNKDARTTVQWNTFTENFGHKVEGKEIVISYHVTNTGNNPYKIRQVKTTPCDCIIVNYPKMAIQPNQSGIVEVRLDSKGMYGNVKHGIVIYDNSRPNLRTILYLEGEISAIDNNPGRN